MKKTALATAIVSLLSHAYTSPVFAQNTATETDETMVVTANRFEQSAKDVIAPVEVVTKEDIEKYQAKSIPDVLRRLTGIQVSQNGGRGQLASIFVRGANSDQVLVLVDGIRFARAAKGGVDFNQLPITYVERIEYIRGARASLYGSEAIGGVINIITVANSKSESTKISVGLGSLDYKEASVSTSNAIGENGHLNIALGYDADDGYNVHPVKGVNDGDRHGFESKNALIGYNHKINENIEVFANARTYENTSQYDGSYFSSFSNSWVYSHKESEVENYTFSGGAKYQNDKFNSKIESSFQKQKSWDYEKELGKEDLNKRGDKLEQKNIQWVNSYALLDNTILSGGIDWRNESYLEGDDVFDRNNTALFGLLSTQVSQFLTELSVRLDDNEQYGSQVTYNAGIGWRLAQEFGVKASYGTAFKAPNLYQLHSFYGNIDLKPEEAESYELAFDGTVQSVYWSVTFYDNKITDLIGYNLGTKKYYNEDGENHIQGIELVSEFDTGLLSHQVSVDFKDPQNKDGEQLTRRSKEIYKWNTTASFDVVDISLGYQYYSERPDGSVELSAYSLFDLSANYYISESTTISGRVDNLFNEEYETANGYPAPERAFYMNMTYQF